MADVLGAVEAWRRRLRLSQLDVARAVGVTQGHYSKVASGRVPLSPDVASRLAAWLQQRGASPSMHPASVRIRELAASIRIQCMELMHLAADAIDEPGGE